MSNNTVKKYLVVAATGFEIAPFIDFLDKNAEKENFFSYKLNNQQITPFVTGIGSLFTSFGISRYPSIGDMNMLLNVGVAGSFTDHITLGDVVEVTQDRFADIGVEEADGSFTDIFELELHDADKYPFNDGYIALDQGKEKSSNLPQVKGITVNKVHGTEESIALIRNKYNPDVESMEGAGFMYACNMLRLKGMQVRSISNYVEARNKESWELNLAIKNLNDFLISYFT